MCGECCADSANLRSSDKDDSDDFDDTDDDHDDYDVSTGTDVIEDVPSVEQDFFSTARDLQFTGMPRSSETSDTTPGRG